MGESFFAERSSPFLPDYNLGDRALPLSRERERERL
jgi:hypothetical protein